MFWAKFTSPLSATFFACMALAIASFPDGLSASPITVQPAESFEQLRTPGVGFQESIHEMPTVSELSNCNYDTSLDSLNIKSGSIYVRMMWQDFEPEEGQYNWTKLDDIFDCARQKGQTIDLRVMLTWPDNSRVEWDSLRNKWINFQGLPEWLLEKGVATHTSSTLSGSQGSYLLPDWDDAQIQASHTVLIQAFASRYDGHPELNSIDIGSVGLWGEWHIFGDEQYMPTNQQQKDIIDLYINSFPNTPLIPIMNAYSVEALDDVSVFLKNKGNLAWRADSWGGVAFHSVFYHSMQAYIPDRWEQGPVSMEVTSIMPDWINRNGNNDPWYATLDIDVAIADALSWHTSSVNLKGHGIPSEYFSETEAMALQMGFRLVLREAVYEDTATAGSTLNVDMDWENVGVAPAYRDFRIAFRLRDSNGTIHALETTNETVKGWLPTGVMNKAVSYNLPTTLAADNYTLETGIVFHSASDRVIPISVTGRTADQWFALGSLTIVDSLPAVVAISPDAVTIPNPVTFTWQAVSEAIDYRLTYEINGVPQANSISKEAAQCPNGTETCSYDLPANLPPGPVGWSIVAINTLGESPNSQSLTFTIADDPELLPASGSFLTASSQLFSWNYNGKVVEQWALLAGSSVGGSEYYVGGAIDNATSTLAINLPTDGSNVYIRLWYRVGSVWESIDATYTAATISSVTPPEIISPSPESTLTAESHIFSWDNHDNAVEQWALLVGDNLGGSEYYIAGSVDNATTTSVTGLPTDGSTVHVRLWYRIGETWNSIDTSYTATTILPVEITSPESGSTMSDSSQTFNWDYHGLLVEQWALLVGSTEGGAEYFISGAIDNATSATATSLPTDGSTIYIRLWYRVGNVWDKIDATYTAATIIQPEITSPTPNDTLSGSSESFTWDYHSVVAEQWALLVGSTVGGSEYYIAGAVDNSISTTATSLPTDGSTIYVRLWFREGSNWDYIDTSYTAFSVMP